MIKKISLIALLFLSSLVSAYADERISVKLNNDNHKQETIELPYCNIFLNMTDDEDGNVKVSVQIENLQDTKGILLFKYGYDEKPLKKMRPTPIVYDKRFGGTKGKRTIDSCDGLDKDCHISPSSKEQILTLTGFENKKSCRLPIYIASYKDKNYILFEKQRLTLLEKQIIELDIEVELKPDTTYLQLNADCNKLLEEFKHKIFCTHKRHKPTLTKQKEEFQEKIDAYISMINHEIDRNGWFSTDKRYKLYDELRQSLKQLDLDSKEGVCDKCQKPLPPSCKYCKSSFQQIYHKLDDYYQKIYSSNNRKTAKEQVMKDVRALYSCCTNHHRLSEWNKSEYKEKIEDRYNRINNF